MINIENVLRDHGFNSGLSKQQERDLYKRIANAEAVLDIYNRTSGASDVFYDLFDGTNDHSTGIMDTRKTTSSQALLTGTTVLTDKVNDATGGDAVNGFVTGSQITIQDDENKEYVNVTLGGVSEESVEYDRSVPTTVVSQNFQTSKDARPQVLSNGWIVSAEYDGSANIYFQVDKIDGNGFIPLCYKNGDATQGFSLSSNGTIVYLMWCRLNSTVSFTNFDALTQTNVNVGTTGTLDSSQTAMGTCSLAINPLGTELHATWSSKNATYPNSFNIRYVKGTISAVDGSVTWGSVEQRTTDNTTGSNSTSPSITMKDDKPVINFAYNLVNNGLILCCYYNGSTWVNNNIVHNAGGTYAQSSPDIITDQSGILFCSWQGKDNVDTSSVNIRCSKSIDGGITWIKPSDSTAGHDKLTSGNTYDQQLPSMTVDKNNKIYLTFYGIISGQFNNQAQIRLITFDTIWSPILNLTSNTTNNATTPSTCLNYDDFTSPILIYKDTQASDVKFRGIFTAMGYAPHLEVTPLQHSYKTNALCYRSLGNVDTVNGRLGFSEGFQSTTTYDRSTPTTVVASAFDTSGNGGRKLVRLSNGWLVSAVFASGFSPVPSIVFYKSSDGTNWSQLCYIGASGFNPTGFAISSYENKVCCIYAKATAVESVSFDATIVTNINLNSAATSVDSNQTATGQCSIEADSLGYLHETHCSKNASLPNSFNIRYSKSIDGGVSWSAVTQVTSEINASKQLIDPCIIIQNGYPKICYHFANSTTENSIRIDRFNGTIWSTNIIYDGVSYTQSNPSTIVDSAGVIHVVWYGTDSTDNSVNNIRYSKSTDGGVTWSTMLKLTTGNSYTQAYPSITFDSNNNLYVLWEGNTTSSPSYIQVRKIIYSSSSWGSVTTLTSNTTGSAHYPSTCSNFTGFTDPLCIYQDNQAVAVKFRGVWTDASYIKFLEESVMYNITPSVSSGEIASWVKYSNSVDFSIDSKFSIKSSGNETFLTPTKTTTVIDANYKEDQYIISAPVGSQIAQKIIMTRVNNATEYYIYQLLGALG